MSRPSYIEEILSREFLHFSSVSVKTCCLLKDEGAELPPNTGLLGVYGSVYPATREKVVYYPAKFMVGMAGWKKII